MSYEKLRDEALKNADYEKVSELAVALPKAFALASKGGVENMTRSTGLILTKEQIISLKEYVAIGLAFPETLDAVIDYLNYGPNDDGGRGLKAQDFLLTFQLIRRHASSWTPLRHRIMLTGEDLKKFGSNMQSWRSGMEAECNTEAAVKLIKDYNVKTLEDLNKLKLDWKGVFPGIELDPGTVSELGEYLKDIRNRIDAYKRTTNDIKADLDTFGDQLESVVIPEIKRKLVLIGNNQYTGEVEALNKKITERALRIDELDSQYKALVVKSLEAAAGLNIFGLGMAIYHGVEAENIRATRRAENEAQEADLLSLKSKDRTLASLKEVEKDLQNTKLVAIDAEVATNNLRYVWNVIDSYVNDSEETMSGIKDALRLSRFMTRFGQVADSWKEVESVAGQLVDVFDQADKEYQAKYGVKVMARRIESFAGVLERYPLIDLKLLSQTKSKMRDDRATADALFIVWQYLPNVHKRFAGLVDNVFISARTLQSSAFNSKHELEKARKTLGGLESELKDEVSGGADQETINSIMGEIEETMQEACESVKESANKSKDSLRNISIAVDRKMMLDFVSGLKRDIQTADQRQTDLQTELTKRRADLKVVSDAISAIEKNGLDDLSKNINLTIDKLKALGMAPSEIQLVMFAVEQLQKSIGDIAKGISFSFMLAESKKLSAKVAEVLGRIAIEITLIEASNKNIEFIEAINLIDDQNRLYCAEYEKAVVAFDKFNVAVDNNSIPADERVLQFLDEVKAFTLFLAPLSEPNP
jgi:hypothetical protein